jgi:hypothetical protein
MGIIAVQLPERLREAIRAGDATAVTREFELWNPLVPIPMEDSSLEETFERIAHTVDQIEDGEFSPPSAERLAQVAGSDENSGGDSVAFATLHCRNCDGRFSCSAYRQYAAGRSVRGRFDILAYVDRTHQDGDIDEWLDGNIELDLERLSAE